MRYIWSILLIFLGLIPITLNAQNIFMISAGVTDYPGTQNDLSLPAKDAKAVYRLYKKNARAEAVLLTDSNATKNHIIQETRRVFNKAKADDIVVFFFSGHGFKGGFLAYDDYLSYDEIRKLFSSCRAKNKMIFADACFSGDIREGERVGYNDPNSNIMLFLSSRSNEVSQENPRMKNGFFTACLLRSLKGGADVDRNRIITAKELFKAVSKGVKDLSNDRQHPVMWGNFSDNMPVMVW